MVGLYRYNVRISQMSIRNLYFTGLFVLALSACSGDLFLVHNGNMPSPDKIAQISKGQTRAEVEQILGSPSLTTTFDDENWIYMSSTMKKVAFFKPEEVNREVLEIKFNPEGKVSQISSYDKSDGTACEIDGSQTETAGHNVGFFRKYFGGVGAYLPVAPSKAGDNL